MDFVADNIYILVAETGASREVWRLWNLSCSVAVVPLADSKTSVS